MVTLTEFEEAHPEAVRLGHYTIYVSLEPCPMCLTRLINAGVGRVKYLAEDAAGGMVHLLARLPAELVKLSQQQHFTRADCSPKLRGLAADIFACNRDELNGRLACRREK